MYEVLTTVAHTMIWHISDNPAAFEQKHRQRRLYFASKRVIDIAVAILLLFLLSPAKSLDYETPVAPAVLRRVTDPLFVDRAAELIEVLRRKSPAQIAALNTNILHIESRNIGPDRGNMEFVLAIRTIQHLRDLVKGLSQVPGVLEVRRM